MNNIPTVLIVDDLEENRLMIKFSLKKEGYIFVEAADGKDGLEKALEIKPEIILADAVMPVMDGFEMIRQLRTDDRMKRTPILMITALKDHEDKIKALECWVTDFIHKPFDKLELILRCRSYIEQAKLNENYTLVTRHPFTGLHNKEALKQQLTGSAQSLVMIKIDDLEEIEEFYHSEIVNEIELYFSSLLPSFLEHKPMVSELFHTDNGEFALLIDRSEAPMGFEELQELCREIYAYALRSSVRYDGIEYDYEVSIGFSFEGEKLYRKAKTALADAIRKKQSIVFGDRIYEDRQREALANLEKIKVLKQALSARNIVPYFQGIVNNHTGKIERYEALARLVDQQQQVHSPWYFLDASKKAKLYTSITAMMIEKSLERFADMPESVSINVSFLDLEERGIVDYLTALLQENPEMASRVTFELLEDEAIDNFGVVNTFIENMKGLGAKIAIDDFGSGYSSFERIIEFEPHFIKIDGSLVKNIHTAPEHRAVVESIHQFASRLGIKTIAEYVHDEQVLKIIREIGIDYSQGFFLHEPSHDI